jgi:hypothetical protein
VVRDLRVSTFFVYECAYVRIIPVLMCVCTYVCTMLLLPVCTYVR